MANELKINTLKTQADTLISLKQQIESLTDALEKEKTVVAEIVKKEKDKADFFVKSIRVLGSEQLDCMLTFAERYSKLAPENEEDLKAAFGDLYNQLFSKVETVEVKPDMKEALITKLGGKAAAKAFLKMEESIVVNKGFDEWRFDNYKTLAKKQKEYVTDIEKNIQATPTLKVVAGVLETDEPKEKKSLLKKSK